MKILGRVAMLLALPSAYANAACIVTPMADEIASAETVFVATITRATMSKSPQEMRDKEGYEIRYEFTVAKVFKGDPSLVTALITGSRFDDPTDSIFWEQAEQSRYAPGDSILVVAGTGEVPVSSIGCTPSRPWDREARRVLAKAFSDARN